MEYMKNCFLFLISETGGLFMLAIRLMQLFSHNKCDFSKLAGLLGLYFQVNDDYINLNSKDVSIIIYFIPIICYAFSFLVYGK